MWLTCQVAGSVSQFHIVYFPTHSLFLSFLATHFFFFFPAAVKLLLRRSELCDGVELTASSTRVKLTAGEAY